jgi:hypothetical protein
LLTNTSKRKNRCNIDHKALRIETSLIRRIDSGMSLKIKILLINYLGDSVILEDVAKVPEPGNDIGGNSAHRWLMFSLMTRYRRVLAAVGVSEIMGPWAPPATLTVSGVRLPLGKSGVCTASCPKARS